MLPCAGFIIFTSNKQKILLIKTHQNVIGFPKGKLNKGEDSLVGAYRELEEETGINKSHVSKVSDESVDELSNKGNPL